MQLLPSELKYHIAELSSRNSLTALARTHSAYQREAEKVLYHSLSIFAYSDKSLKCMETLVTNSEKAALVRFLTIVYGFVDIKTSQTMRNYLSKILISMHSLSDFRVRCLPGLNEELKRVIECLDKILCEGHFQLQTLYCENFLNISQIIKSQTELQILGLYIPCNPPPGRILKTLKELHDDQLLERKIFTPIDQISIFPAFCSVDRSATIHQVLTQSFCKDPFDYMRCNADGIVDLSIYSSDMSSIYALAKDMALSIPKIDFLNLWLERRCEIPPQEIKEVFSFFPNLHSSHGYLNTYVWPTDADTNIPEDG